MFRSSSRPIWIIRLGFRFYSVMFGGVWLIKRCVLHVTDRKPVAFT
jgi:hypothetical protein